MAVGRIPGRGCAVAGLRLWKGEREGMCGLFGWDSCGLEDPVCCL